MRILWNTITGIGLLDAMALPSVDSNTGENFPAYYVFNNNHHLPPDMKSETDEPRSEFNAIIYDIKAGSSNDDQIHSNFLAQINNGTIALLAHERIAPTRRENFNETAFFFPQLRTNDDGSATFSFTMPDALTRWRLMLLAYSKDRKTGSNEYTFTSSKPVMIMADMPRYRR